MSRFAYGLLAALLFAPSARAGAQSTTRDSAVQAQQAGRAAYQRQTRTSLDSALILWRSALLLFQRAADSTSEAAVLGSLGIVHNDLGATDSALSYYGAAIQLERVLRNRKREAAILSNIGVVHINQGRLDSALAHYRAALSIQQDIADTASVGLTLSNIGVVYRQRGQFDSALAYYGNSLLIRRRTGDRAGQAATLHNIGNIFNTVGQQDSALAYFNAALPIRREVNDLRGEGRTLEGIGHVYVALGQPESALPHLERALELHRQTGNRMAESNALHTIGAALFDLGRLDSAQVYSLRALEIRRAIGDRMNLGNTLTGIGMIHQARGSLDSARVYLRLAIENDRATGNRLGEGRALVFSGLLHSWIGQTDSALAASILALAVTREVGDRVYEATSLQVLGQIHHRAAPPRRNLATAVAYYDSSAAAVATLAGAAGADLNRVSIGERGVGLFEGWALAFLARSSELGPESSAAAALAVTERGRARALLKLMSATSDTVAAHSLRGLMRDTRAGLAAGADLAAEGSRLVSGVTRGGAGGLFFLATNDTLLVWVASPARGVILLRRPISRDTLAARIGDLLAGMGADGSAVLLATRGGSLEAPDSRPTDRPVGGAAWARAGQALSRALGLEEALTHLGDVREVVIVPHGPLAGVPFAALPVGPSGEAFGASRALRYAPSLATLGQVELRPKAASGPGRTPLALVVGNPRMPEMAAAGGERSVLTSLPGAEIEGRAVARQLGAGALIGPLGSETEVRKRLAQAPVVHLATHGFAYSAEAKALASFVALAPDSIHDGALTVGELLNDPALRLTADLVVLSACQTGLGNLRQAEGTVGLQRAFLAKGARSVLVSLWNVSDQATRQLMDAFYRHWLGAAGPTSKAEALQRAQEEVRKTPGFEHPRFWAAFQLVGAS